MCSEFMYSYLFIYSDLFLNIKSTLYNNMHILYTNNENIGCKFINKLREPRLETLLLLLLVTSNDRRPSFKMRAVNPTVEKTVFVAMF